VIRAIRKKIRKINKRKMPVDAAGIERELKFIHAEISQLDAI
jgi:hypothetical protein